MKPEAANYLLKAREYLSKARNFLDVMDYSDEASRAATLAGFHATQALIFVRTNRIAKSHSGLRSTFARLTKEDPRIDRKFTRFLARAYSFKEVTDYGVGSHAIVTSAEAKAMIDTAVELVDLIEAVLS